MICEKCGQKNKGRFSKIWKMIVFCLLLLSGPILYYNFYQGAPKIVSQFIDALHEKEFSKAYYAFTTTSFRNKSDLIEFKNYLSKHPIFLNDPSYKIESKKKGTFKIKLLLSKQKAFLFVEKELGEYKVAKIELEGDSFPYAKENKREIEKLILGQLASLKKGEAVHAYYAFMSRRFQNRISLGSFQEMVEHFAPLNDFETAELIKVDEESRSVARGRVAVDGLEADYTIVKENNSWKVDAFELIQDKSEVKEGPKEAIQSQLQAIRLHEMAKAYFDFTSREFQESISLQDFKKFLKKQDPFFHHRSLEIHSVKEEEKEAVVLTTLKSIEDHQLPVEFQLVLEDNSWKINHILMN